jgi:REP element-mobilizing transposase RayT
VFLPDDHDRQDFLHRIETLVAAHAFTLYAWALLPNHLHLLVHTAQRPLARSMRALLSGYASAFNRRHRRSGHLFQNRYKSIVCEDEPYFLELVCYLHLNPLRAGLVPDIAALAQYPYSGHAALLGQQPYPWQDTDTVLGHFASTRRRARREYTSFVAAGVAQGRCPDLQGGGLVRSAGGWTAVQALRQGREGYAADERILGGSDFVEALRQEVEAIITPQAWSLR